MSYYRIYYNTYIKKYGIYNKVTRLCGFNSREECEFFLKIYLWK